MSVELDHMHGMTPTRVLDFAPQHVAVPLGAVWKLQRTLYVHFATAWRFAQAIRQMNGFCDEGAAARIAV